MKIVYIFLAIIYFSVLVFVNFRVSNIDQESYLWIQTRGENQEILEHVSVVRYESDQQLITLLYIPSETSFQIKNDKKLSLQTAYHEILKSTNNAEISTAFVSYLSEVISPYLGKKSVQFPSKYIFFNQHPQEKDTPLFETSKTYKFEPIFAFRNKKKSEIQKSSDVYQSVLDTKDNVVKSKFFQYYFVYHLKILKSAMVFFSYLAQSVAIGDDKTNIDKMSRIAILFQLKNIPVENIYLTFCSEALIENIFDSFYTNINHYDTMQKDKMVVEILNASTINKIARFYTIKIRENIRDIDILRWENYGSLRNYSFLINHSSNKKSAIELAKFMGISLHQIIGRLKQNRSVDMTLILGADITEPN